MSERRGQHRRFGATIVALLLVACADKSDPPRTIAGADAARGVEVVQRVGCAACHTTPGVDWPKGASGPSLEGFGERPFIAGRLPNQPDVLTAWVADAPSLSPETAMPPMPLTESEARDVAAWLYTLR